MWTPISRVNHVPFVDVKELKHRVHESQLEIEEEQRVDRVGQNWQDVARSEYEAYGLADTDEALQYAIMMSQEDGEEAELERALLAIAAAEGNSSPSSPLRSRNKSVGPGSDDEKTHDEIELEEALVMIRLAEEAENRGEPGPSHT